MSDKQQAQTDTQQLAPIHVTTSDGRTKWMKDERKGSISMNI